MQELQQMAFAPIQLLPRTGQAAGNGTRIYLADLTRPHSAQYPG